MRTQLVQLICKGYMRCLKWAAHIIPMPRPTLFLGDDASKEMTKSIGLFGIERIMHCSVFVNLVAMFGN